ncbi:MAG: Calx-beta domain-containing protein [Gloeotrichia echinulata IR180]
MAVKNGTASSDELYANQNDQVFGLEGDDILDASNGQGNNLLDGGSGNDQLFANNNDTLKGGAGEDSLYAVGSLGVNSLEGGDDNDKLFVVEGGNNKLDGGTGDDQLTVSDGTGYNTLVGGLGNDRLNVSNPTGNNIVSGNEGDDILIGGLASDQLFGGAGDDLLFGGVKGSQLTGGTGADSFYIGSAGVTEVAVEVLDFTKGQDKFVIAAIPEVQGFANLILEQTGADTTVKANIGGSVKALGILKNIQANTITANDFNFIVPIFSIANASAVEGNAVNFTITRTGDILADQTVTVSTAINTGDTASNTDFTTKTETITFTSAETQKTFTVQTTQDALFESDETFSVSLSNPTNGAIIDPTKGTAKGTITNDDPAPVFAIASSSAVEGNAIAFTITRTGDAQADQTVNVSTAINTGDTASDTDLTTKIETITFKSGETQKTFTVQTTQDAVFESDETFSVSLSNPTNGAIIDPTKGTAKGTITNDDPAPIFAIASSSAVEGNAIAFTITRTGDAQADQTVTVSTAINTDDTASDNDFKAKTETITFKQGETQKTFTVETTQDDKYEKDELFTVALTNPTNGAIISSTNGTAKGTINNDDIPMAKNPDNDIFTLKGIDKARLKVTLTGQSSNLVNELGVFTVDDTSGKIGSDRAAYVKENLAKAQIIFSTIANVPNGFDTNNLTRVLEFDGDVKNLRFYLVRNSTTESVVRGQTSTTEVLFGDASVQKFTSLGADSYSLAWEDGSGNSTDFKDLVVKLESTNDPLPLGTKLQGSADGSEVIDLRNQTKEVTASFTVYREAAYNNLVGFYQVDDATGRIGTLNPGDAGYAQAAVGKRVVDIDLRVSNQQIATFADKKFSPGAIFAPFIITNGVTVDQVLNGQVSQIYFAYIGANSDKVDHVRLLGNNIFGFEDLPGGGDRDFNDVIVKVNLQ